MVVGTAFGIFITFAVITLFRPRLGLVLIWLSSYLYPNTLLYGTLPLNIRLDDLWVSYMFVVALLSTSRSNAMRPVVLLSFLWVIGIMIGDVAGAFNTGSGITPGLVKSALKTLHVPFTTFALAAFLTDERSLDSHIKWLLFAGACCALLGIGTLYAPRLFEPFLIPDLEFGGDAAGMIEAGRLITRRAQGSVGTSALAAICLLIAIIGVCMVGTKGRPGRRTFIAAMTAFCGLGMIYANSRGAYIALIAALIWGIIFTPWRSRLIVVTILGASAVLLQGELIERILFRISGEATLGGQYFWSGLRGRVDVWSTVWENATITELLIGQGMGTVVIRTAATAHNAYIGALVYTGVFGTATQIAIVVYAIVSARRLLRRGKDLLSQAIGANMIMVLVATAVAGIAAETFQTLGFMQIFFACLVFTVRRLEQVDVQLGGEEAMASAPHLTTGPHAQLSRIGTASRPHWRTPYR